MKFSPNTRYLIIHADDGGLCHSVNRAIIDAMESGIVTSTSLMVPCPQFDEIAEFFRYKPQYDVGIHLTLTCEYPHYPWSPVADVRKVSSLVNSDGYFWHSVDEFSANATPDNVELEMRSQIERSLELGLKPTHLDSHQGTVFRDMRFIESYVRLGLEYKITPMLLNPNEHHFRMFDFSGLSLDETVIKDLMASGLPFLNFLFMVDNIKLNLAERERQYINAIEHTPSGLSEIIIHPGYDNEELRAITAHSGNRHHDFSVFTNSTIRELLGTNQIELIGWKELTELT